MLIFDMQCDNDLFLHMVYWFTSVHPAVLPSIPFLVKFWVKDFFTTMQARMLIFGMQVDDDLLYHGIENQPAPAYS